MQKIGFNDQDPLQSVWSAAGTKPTKKRNLYPICVCAGREEWSPNLIQKHK